MTLDESVDHHAFKIEAHLRPLCGHLVPHPDQRVRDACPADVVIAYCGSGRPGIGRCTLSVSPGYARDQAVRR
jgi:hypothetical protein